MTTYLQRNNDRCRGHAGFSTARRAGLANGNPKTSKSRTTLTTYTAISQWIEGRKRGGVTGEFRNSPIPQLPPTYGPIQPITVDETMVVLKRTKPGKATDDDVAAELWVSRHFTSPELLAGLFNWVVAQKKTPLNWQRSTTTPIWKKEGNSANHRPTHLLTYNVNIFECIIGR
ncbi:hypothetical protein Y032_0397g703 [Ancylostoma ceylanicum]|uniref:Uncharacterized protein n=1 Tax=Ancylostoma ceylanicum TaxID=53326 RepID=A0A016RRF5_9BILA|nr:hypothetical protein Y032_0397g703 [Ancylostoma ceylanicum]